MGRSMNSGVDRLTTPADLIGALRWDLVHGLDARDRVLTDARHGIGDRPPAAEVALAALDALAYGRALADNALRFEWIAQVEALRYGATLTDVATASGLDVDEVLAGLRSRVAGQAEHGLMDRAVANELTALVDRADIARRLAERHGDTRP